MRRQLVSGISWVLGTAVAVALSTAAVAMVGERVTDREVPKVSEEAVEAALAEEVPDPGAPPTEVAPDAAASPPAAPGGGAGLDATRSPGGPGGPVTQVAGDDSGSGSGSVSGAGSPSGADDGGLRGDGTVDDGGGSGGGDSSGPGPGPSTTAPAEPVAATYVTDGGTVAVECRGTTISLLYATPATGYAIDGTPRTGPDEVEVRFRPFGGGGDQEHRVRARCEGGRPVRQS